MITWYWSEDTLFWQPSIDHKMVVQYQRCAPFIRSHVLLCYSCSWSMGTILWDIVIIITSARQPFGPTKLHYFATFCTCTCTRNYNTQCGKNEVNWEVVFWMLFNLVSLVLFEQSYVTCMLLLVDNLAMSMIPLLMNVHLWEERPISFLKHFQL